MVGGAQKHTMSRSTIRHFSKTSSQLVNGFRALYNGHRYAASSQSDRLRDILIIQLAKDQEDFEYVERLCIKMNRGRTGVHMVSHMGPVIKPGFLIGWLNGQRIGCISACKFGEINNGLAYLGFNLLDESYHGRGIGLQLTVAVIECLVKGWNIAINVQSDYELTPKFYTIFGVTERSPFKDYSVQCSRIIAAYQPDPGLVRNVTIKPIDQVDFDELSVYDTSVFGFPRHEFLKRWITIPQSTGFVATNENGDIVGYSAMQPALINNKEQIIGPLFSDNESITRSLLYTLAKAAIDPQMGGANTMRLRTNSGVARMLEEEVGCDYYPPMEFAYTKGIPLSQASPVSLEKVVSVTSGSFG